MTCCCSVMGFFILVVYFGRLGLLLSWMFSCFPSFGRYELWWLLSLFTILICLGNHQSTDRWWFMCLLGVSLVNRFFHPVPCVSCHEDENHHDLFCLSVERKMWWFGGQVVDAPIPMITTSSWQLYESSMTNNRWLLTHCDCFVLFCFVYNSWFVLRCCCVFVVVRQFGVVVSHLGKYNG